MLSPQGDQLSLTNFYQAINNQETLFIAHITRFQDLISDNVKFKFLNEYEMQFPLEAPDIDVRPSNLPSFQIVYVPGNFKNPQLATGHFKLIYYNTKEVVVYDPFNNPFLDDSTTSVIKSLYPYVFSNNNEPDKIKFATVVPQKNATDCGVYSIAFAVSIFYGYDPQCIHYFENFMRDHLLEMYQKHQISHFPFERLSHDNTFFYLFPDNGEPKNSYPGHHDNASTSYHNHGTSSDSNDGLHSSYNCQLVADQLVSNMKIILENFLDMSYVAFSNYQHWKSDSSNLKQWPRRKENIRIFF